MDKKGLIGLLLIAGILFAWQYMNQPSPEEIAKMKAQAKQDSVNIAIHKDEEVVDTPTPIIPEIIATDSASQSAADSLQNMALVSKYGSLASSAQGTEEYTTVSTPIITTVFSNKGGRMVSVELNEYNTYTGEPLLLFTEDSSMLDFDFNFENRSLKASDFYFESEVINPVSGTDSTVVIYRAFAGSKSSYIEQRYTFFPDEYMSRYAINFVGMNEVVAENNNSILLNWNMRALNKEKGMDLQKQKTTFFYRTNDGDTDYLSEGRDDEEVLELPAQWIAFKQQFFSVVLISNNSFKANNTVLTTKTITSSDYVSQLTAKIDAELNNGGIAMDMYLGPNGYSMLKEYDIDLDHQIDLGWGIFGWVNRFIVIPVFNVLDGTGLSYGIIILILTVFIKLLLSPITYKTYLSSAKMKVLKPEIEEINKKFKDGDNMKKQQAMMDLYKQTGVNPMAGCIPMLIQMPILYAMFRFFPAALELRQEGFLWADDLSAYDSIYDLGFNIPFYGDHISGFTILMAVSMIFYTRNNSQMSMGGGMGGAQESQMKIMMWMMPVMMAVFLNSFAAGLTLYYFIANMTTMGQQFLIKKFFINEDKIHAKLQANKTKPKKKGMFAKQMEKMTEAQQEAQNRQARRRNK
ncbi:MAG: membrane protein insertase YidC [Salibacteraceae bacterium]